MEKSQISTQMSHLLARKIIAGWEAGAGGSSRRKMVAMRPHRTPPENPFLAFYELEAVGLKTSPL